MSSKNGPASSLSITFMRVLSFHCPFSSYARFEITDGEGNVALVIAGPWCTFSCASDVVFKVMTADESEEVGRIAKNWTGILREAVTDMDNFTVR